MAIRCIALDLDRTTLNAQGRLSEGNRAALEYAIQKGVHVVIASGRAFSTLPEDVLALKGIQYAITSNGAAVYHVPTGECLCRHTLTPRSVERILELTAGERASYEAFIEGKAFAAAAYVRDPVRYGATPEAVAYVQSTRHLVEDIRGFILDRRDRLDSMDVVVPSKVEQQRIWTYLEKEIPDIYITSSVQQLLEISHKNAGKHSGLRFVLERLGLEREESAAFGDGDNDADMLRFAGCGVAVANASPGCLAAADLVTKSHDEDGVAHAIRKLLEL